MKLFHAPLRARPFAVIAILTFLPPVASFFGGPAGVWLEYIGIIFHLSMFFLVATLAAPPWGRAAGYGWVLLDVLTGVLYIHEAPPDLALAVRLSGHIFAGLWLVSTAHRASHPIKAVGTVCGLWLGGYTFVSTQFSMHALAPTSILMIVWLVLVARENVSAAPEGGLRAPREPVA